MEVCDETSANWVTLIVTIENSLQLRNKEAL